MEMKTLPDNFSVKKRMYQVVLRGFEPRQAEPKTAVLPLHHKTISVPKSFPLSAPQSYYFFLKRQNISAQKIKLSPKTFACQIF